MAPAALRAAAVGALIATLLVGVGSGAPPKADIDHRNTDGSTPLQWAVYEGNAGEVRRLLDAGADVSLANDYGATPMSLAAEVGDAAMLKLLLEAGANADSPECRRPDGADGRGAHGQRRRRTPAARSWRHGRRAREVRWPDGPDVGVRAPTSRDDRAA